MGLDGKPFMIYKFRSMYDDAEARPGRSGRATTIRARTPLGRLLRRSNIDELPQFWNVLRGDMSIVGPRPERPLLRRAVQAPDPAVHAASQGEGRHHRLGAGQRLARQHLDRKAHRVRPLLHRELVGPSRSKIMWLTLLKGFFHKHAY